MAVTLTFRRVASALFAVLLPVAIAISAGCSDQGEGERCDTRADRAGSDDCQAGLSCVPFSDLGGSAAVCENLSTCGVCCPTDRTQSSTDVCALSTTLVGADAAAPPDSGTDSSSVTDAAVDSGVDAASDAGTDSGIDSGATDASDANAPADASEAG